MEYAERNLSRSFGRSVTRNLITRVLTYYHVRRAQNIALERKGFDLRSLSPALPNLWLLLVNRERGICDIY